MNSQNGIRKKKGVVSLVAAILFPIFSLIFQIVLGPILGNHKLLFFYPVVLFIAWIRGPKPGYICTLSSALLAAYFFYDPKLKLHAHDINELVEIVFFILIGFSFSYMIGKIHLRDTTVATHARDLEKSREFLDSLLENIPLMVFVKDAADLRFIRFNKAGENLIGFTREELIGKSDYDFFTKEQADFFITKDREVLSGNNIVDIKEEVIQTRNLGTRILHTKKIPLYGQNGVAEYLLGVSEDITDKKNTEEEILKIIKEQAALHEREVASARESFLAEASTLLASSLDYHETLALLANLSCKVLGDWCTISIIKEDGEYERVTAAHSNPKLINEINEYLEHYPPDPKVQIVKYTSSYINSQIQESELVAMAKDKRHLELMKILGANSSMIVPIIVSGKHRGVLSFIAGKDKPLFNHQDLSLAEELGRRAGIAIENSLLYASAQNAIKARDEFVSIASHELKTPITSLKMQLQMMLRLIDTDTGTLPPAHKLKKSLENSSHQVDRLTILIEDLLDITRIEKGKLTYNFEKVNLSELVKEVVERFIEDFRRAHCELQIDIKDEVYCYCDRYRIEQVVTNLITNSIKYGSEHPVRINVEEEGSYANFSVQDNGMGIPQDKHAKIFERFERAISSTNISGLGLGLYISKQIIDAHQGTIKVESEVNRGALFKVSLPNGL